MDVPKTVVPQMATRGTGQLVSTSSKQKSWLSIEWSRIGKLKTLFSITTGLLKYVPHSQ